MVLLTCHPRRLEPATAVADWASSLCRSLVFFVSLSGADTSWPCYPHIYLSHPDVTFVSVEPDGEIWRWA